MRMLEEFKPLISKTQAVMTMVQTLGAVPTCGGRLA